MIWDITNQSMMPHPWHIHGNHFFIQSINGSAVPANMQGRKDVVVVPPQGGNVKLIMKYVDFENATLPYMYHCHIASHEDKGMMGQFLVTSKNPESINQIDVEELGISIFPNPTIGNITITSLTNNIEALTLINELGQIVYTIKPFSRKSTINMTTYSNGLYHLKVETTQGIKSLSILKK
jgi:bilirubin oxidase